ncbi:hypothetical protein EDB84DRAFT_1679530 [Lactarius hengduanensis]|nr:hypothetical protein EDB84DRAFT_1679530 [Lactarius hengduanensis]
MSSSSQTAAPSLIFKSMLDTALAGYKKETGKDILTHQIANELKTCESVDGVLNILRDQAKAFERSGDQKLMTWIDPLVHVLYTFSGALGDGVSLVLIMNPTLEAFPPAKVIFTGIGVLLAAAKDARASHAAVIDLFQRIESFFKRLGVYRQTSLTTEMAEVLVKIVIELLSILSIRDKGNETATSKNICQETIGEDRYRGRIKEAR